MRVVTSLDDLHLDGPALLTVGTFDGVHRGHRFLLEQAQRRAEEHGYRLVIVTFEPSPAVVLHPEVGRYQLTTARQKLALLRSLGPSMVAMIHFTHEVARLTAPEFLDRVESQMALREMWLGEDFHFGRDRQGGLAMLVERGQESGFSLHVVARRMEERTSISSSRIREMLRGGHVDEAIHLLGRPFALQVPGESPLGLVADLPPGCYAIAPHLVLPADGCYAALATADGGESEALVARVRNGPDSWQLQIRPLPAAPDLSVEFLAPLAMYPEDQDSDERILRVARDLVEGWMRPEYPAAGDY